MIEKGYPITGHPMSVVVVLLEEAVVVTAAEFNPLDHSVVARELMRQLLHVALESLGDE